MNLLQTMMQNFANAQIGESPTAASDAFTQLQNSINTRYDTQQKAFEADPANAGKAYTLPSPTERMRDEVYGMIQSKNPTLMKQGLELLNDYYQRSTDVATDPRTALQKEYATAVEQGYTGTQLDYAKELKAAGRSNVSVSNFMPGTGVSGINFLSEEDKQRLNLPQKTAYYVNKNGEIKEAPGGKDIESQQQAQVTGLALDELGSLMFDEGGLYDKTDEKAKQLGASGVMKRGFEVAYPWAQQYLQDDPRYAQAAGMSKNLVSSIGRSYLGEKQMSDNDTARIMEILPDIVKDGRALAQRKLNYLRRITKETDPTKIRQLIYSNPYGKGSGNGVSQGIDNAAGRATSANPNVIEGVTKSGRKYTIERASK